MWILYAVVAALVFGLCYLADKGFVKLFRSKKEHRSGESVRLNKRYGAFGLILFVLGLVAVLSGISGDTVLLVGGIVVLLIGIALMIYYMTFGVFFDEDTFLVMRFLKKDTVYRYDAIQAQKLYSSYGGVVIVELYLEDGTTVQLQSGMSDMYTFLDKAFYRWCEQKGIQAEDCAFYDSANSKWFPDKEES